MLVDQLMEINIDTHALEEHVKKQISEKINQIENYKIFYSLEDLSYITSFSQGHIKNTFFYDSRFKRIRRRVGRKWAFPVKETNEFLTEWIKEQPNE